MTFYFVGGEDHDFTRIGTCSVDTSTTAARRTANARCALKVGTGASATDGWVSIFSAPVSQFWMSAQLYSVANGGPSLTADILALLDGITRRLSFRPSSTTSGSATWVLNKVSASGTSTTLATATAAVAANALIKVDIFVNYAVAGQVQVYLDGTKVIDYTGNVTTDSATTLSGAVLGQQGVANSLCAGLWSEVVVSSDDTRSISIVTLPPTANGNAFDWTGSFADVDEVTVNDSDLATSATANQLAQTKVTSSGITGTPVIKAVCVSARAQKGGTGPQNAQLSVRTNGNDYFSGTTALPVALNRVAAVFETNPATAGAWGYTDLTAAGFNVGIKSIT